MLLLLLLACTTTELSQSWQIDRLRVLAVAAEPAEPRPGDTVRFNSLVVSPEVPLAAVVWFACPGSGTDVGCEVDTSSFEGSDVDDLASEDLDALYDAGFIGADPYLPPVWEVPVDALDGLSDTERLEGLTSIVNVIAVPDLPAPEQDDLEVAFKRVPISEATTPNHNPRIEALTVDGERIAPDTVVSLDRGEPYTLGLVLDDTSVETYTYVNQEGAEEVRTEEPYFTWYAQEGSFDRTFDLWPHTDATYYAPSSPKGGETGVWVVVRDRRGGMAWASLRIRYR